MKDHRHGYSYVNDNETAYAGMTRRVLTCHEHGGTDDPAECEWCMMREVFSDDFFAINL